MKKILSFTTVTSFLLFVLFVLPLASAHAELRYAPIVSLPEALRGEFTFDAFINYLYSLSISVAAMLAVVKIIIAGMKYMMSDVVTNKSEAIKDIQGALFGLLVVIGAVLIITVINPTILSI